MYKDNNKKMNCDFFDETQMSTAKSHYALLNRLQIFTTYVYVKLGHVL